MNYLMKNKLMGISPKKSLGQNFLVDRNICSKIAQLVVNDNLPVIEIGPGTGALTDCLLIGNSDVHCIEIDDRAIEELNVRFGDIPHFYLFHADFLEFDLSSHLHKHSLKKVNIAGNLPYYISSQIIFKLLNYTEFINSITITVQKEFAERLVAKPNSKAYGTISVAIGLAGNAKGMFDINPRSFFPVPKVQSRVVKINILNNPEPKEIKGVMSIVRAAFNYRRKKLSNALEGYLKSNGIIPEVAFSKINRHIPGIAEKRAENLSVNDFQYIYNVVCQMRAKNG